MDFINRSPVTFSVIGLYMIGALLTDFVDPHTEQLLRFGAASGLLIMEGEPWRLVTHCFLHGGWVHLAEW